MDVHQHPKVAPELLQPGFEEFTLDPGLWNTSKNKGWCEIGGEIVDVDTDEELDFVIAKWEVARRDTGPYVKTFGGFSFAGVRLLPLP